MTGVVPCLNDTRSYKTRIITLYRICPTPAQNIKAELKITMSFNDVALSSHCFFCAHGSSSVTGTIATSVSQNPTRCFSRNDTRYLAITLRPPRATLAILDLELIFTIKWQHEFLLLVSVMAINHRPTHNNEPSDRQ